MSTYRLMTGDVNEQLATLPSSSVQCVVTSPPYWSLRDYGVDGQIGKEPTLQAYIERLVGVFESIKRVLRDDGCMFVNMGDAYAGSWGAQGRSDDGPAVSAISQGQVAAAQNMRCTGSTWRTGIQPKNLLGQPWRLAFGLQDAGWILRSDIIWAKPNPMPESVRDRPTKSHEYVFLFSKKERYYYDMDAVKEKATGLAPGNTKPCKGADRDEMRTRAQLHTYVGVEHRNLRTVWTIAAQPSTLDHFASYPEDLVEPCVKAGSKPGDTILDPFSGTGTTGVVALKNGRDYIGIDISHKYQQIARKRLMGVTPLFCKETPC